VSANWTDQGCAGERRKKRGKEAIVVLDGIALDKCDGQTNSLRRIDCEAPVVLRWGWPGIIATMLGLLQSVIALKLRVLAKGLQR
jgi:hypothetical protein